MLSMRHKHLSSDLFGILMPALFSFVYEYRCAKGFVEIMKEYYKYFQKHLMSPYLQCSMRLGMVILVSKGGDVHVFI